MRHPIRVANARPRLLFMTLTMSTEGILGHKQALAQTRHNLLPWKMILMRKPWK